MLELLRIALVAGVLFALALYLKESPLYLTGLLGIALAWLPRLRLEGLRRASLFLLVIAVCVVATEPNGGFSETV